MSEINATLKNIIFYGPPGTGKTYNTVKRAVDIIDGKDENLKTYSDYLKRYEELKNAGLIEFTTFHQSYGYEDFIEGIRPVMGDKNEASDLKYKIHDGVFKAFCNKEIIIPISDNVWAVRPGRSNETEKACLDNGYIQCGDAQGFETQAYNFINGMQIGDIVLLYTITSFTYNSAKIKENIEIKAVGIITGACKNVDIEDYPHRRKVIWLDTRIDDAGFNQIKSQIASSLGTLKISDNMSAEYIINTFNLVDKIKRNNNQFYYESNKVFIIDEINRGNISKIFGELITLIEDTKRLGASDSHSVKLPYSNEDFGVPDNVYIIGTMNTADRSIAALDTALRRRFDFEEMMPNSRLLKDITVDSINIKDILDTINKRIEVLYDREHQIGHAYFMSLNNESKIEELGSIFKYQIIPLLQEYFYEDYDKIRLVLGDNIKAEEFQFIKKETQKHKDLFGEDRDFDTDELIKYSINEAAFSKPEAYKKIYE